MPTPKPKPTAKRKPSTKVQLDKSSPQRKKPPQQHGIVNRVLPIAALTAHPRNYNTHPEVQLLKLQASLIRFGQVRSVVVQQGAPNTYLIVAGHGLIDAAIAQGLTQIRADIIPATWTDEQVTGYLLADNLTARDSVPDEATELSLLQSQVDAGFDLLSVGSYQDELDDLFAKLHAPSLDDLAATYGAEEDNEDVFWPVIRMRVPQDVLDRFNSLMDQAPAHADHIKLAQLLAAVDHAIL